MRSLLAALLVLEAVVVALAIPVAVVAGDRGASTAWVLGVLAVLLLLGAGVVRRPQGVAVGWALQALVLLSGVLVPALAVLGAVFLAVWVLAIVYGSRGDRMAAENAARARSRAGEAGPPAGGPAAGASGSTSGDG